MTVTKETQDKTKKRVFPKLNSNEEAAQYLLNEISKDTEGATPLYDITASNKKKIETIRGVLSNMNEDHELFSDLQMTFAILEAEFEEQEAEEKAKQERSIDEEVKEVVETDEVPTVGEDEVVKEVIKDKKPKKSKKATKS